MESKWEKVHLSDVANLTVGFVGTMAQHYVDNGVTFLRSTNIEPFNINLDDVKYISPEFHQQIKKSQLEAGDVVIVRTGKPGASTVIPAIKDSWNCSDLVIVHPDQGKILPLYLASYINLAYGVINANLVGAVQQHFNVGSAKKLIIDLPPLSIQRQIVTIIQAIHDKIELNQKINENLERQAQAIFQRWLLENDGQCTFRPLAEVAKINSDTYSLKESWEYVNYLDTSSITDGTISEIQQICLKTEKLPSRARRKVEKGDIVYSTVRPNQRHFGIISSPLPNMLVSTGFAVIRSKQPQICNELIYLLITDSNFIERMQQLAEQSTSTFPSIKPSDLGTCSIPYPLGKDGDELSTQLKTLYSFIAINNTINVRTAKFHEYTTGQLYELEKIAKVFYSSKSRKQSWEDIKPVLMQQVEDIMRR